MIEHEIETSKVFTELKNRLSELEKEIAELKQAKTIAQLNLDNSKLSYRDREYIAISLKHSTKDCIMYWGTRTQDNESRCFSGYTENFLNCELYSPDEFYSLYGKELSYC